MKTLFLHNISCIDHALIDKNGILAGGSYHINCLVSGDVVGEEQVVVDFSKLKGTIKSLIDDIKIGYDHKCWIIQNYSNCEIIRGDDISIETNSFKIRAPYDAFAFFNEQHVIHRDIIVTIEEELSNFLKREIEKIYPNINLQISAILNQEAFIPSRLKHNTVYFNYTHGLKNSSSIGCQNIAHGHYSFISLGSRYLNHQIDESFLEKIRNDVGNSFSNVFIFRENIIEDNDKFIKIGYKSPRGYFEASYLKNSYQIIILDTETTIENIIDFFFEKYKQEISQLGIKHLYVSEGLQKGSYRRIQW